jgi:peptidoglycan hydrolase-like protein with peptidoglycan-binding domain
VRPRSTILAAVILVVAGYLAGLTAPAAAQQAMVPDATALAVQEGLASLGYDPGPTDGKPGPATKAAIEAYQRDHQMPVDGQVTRELSENIDKSAAHDGGSPEQILARANMLRSYTRAIQDELLKMGYDPGPVDGTLGAQTREAIKAYERDNGLPERGLVSKSLLARMHGLTTS